LTQASWNKLRKFHNDALCKEDEQDNDVPAVEEPHPEHDAAQQAPSRGDRGVRLQEAACLVGGCCEDADGEDAAQTALRVGRSDSAGRGAAVLLRQGGACRVDLCRDQDGHEDGKRELASDGSKQGRVERHGRQPGPLPRGAERRGARSSTSAELATAGSSGPVCPERPREQLPLPRLLPTAAAASAARTAAVAGATTTRTQVRPQEQGKRNGKGEGPEQTR